MEDRARTSRRLAVAIATSLGICSPAVPAQEPEDCGVYYFGIGQPRDFKRAFACEMRSPDDQRDWMIVAVMYLNGEGTAASVKKARDAFRHLDSADASSDALEKAIEMREANPRIAFPRIDYCREIAQTTLDGNYCDSVRMRKVDVAAKGVLKAAGADLDSAAAKRFTELKRAFDAFRRTDSQRLYLDFAQGTIRNAMATGQEDLVQRNFLAAVNAWGPKASPPPPKRSLVDADKELNKAYRALIDQYETDRADAKNAARDAQRAWLKYAAAWKSFAEALRPDNPRTDDVRAFLTEQRIRELQTDGEDGGPKK
jgi:Protein of unknown function (DUF1311).